VVLVGMPGAFTPTCHRNHLPGFIENRDVILEKGADEIAVLTTNDTHVMRAWAEATGAKGRITFLSDGNAEFVRKAGLDYTERGQRHGSALQTFRRDRRRRRGHGDLGGGFARPGRDQLGCKNPRTALSTSHSANRELSAER
jgi:hypothetical protein